MPAIIKRPRARDDLIEIWEVIAEDSMERADAFIDHLDAKLQLLAAHPMMGRTRDELARGLRSFRLVVM